MSRNTEHAAKKRSVKAVLTEACRFFKAAPYAAKIIWRFEPRMLLLMCCSTVLEGIAPLFAVWVMRYVMDALVEAYQHHGEALYVKRVIGWCLLQILVAAGCACLGRVVYFFRSALASKLALDIQADLIGGMHRLQMEDYDDPEVYNMISRAWGEAQSNKPLTIVSGVCDILSNVITSLGFSIVLFKFSPLVVAAMFAICIPYFILNIYFAKANFNLQYGRTHEQREVNYLASCFTNRRYLPEIIVLDLWGFLRGKWRGVATLLMQQNIALLKRRTTAELWIIVLAYLGRGGVLLYIVFRCVSRSAEYTIGQLTMFIQACSGGISAATQILQQISAVYEGSCFLQNYKQFQELRAISKAIPKNMRPVPEVIESVECCDVSFAYPGSVSSTLKKINLRLVRGQRTLLAGRNGAGKTTLARLLIGLYSPTSGRILVNGCDAREYDSVALRKKMSMIFQDYTRYALTAQENIGIGNTEHMKEQQRVLAAVRAARFDEVIARLPSGYNTMLGKEFRDGQDLSLGEWQRLCLARMFMRQSSLMIYDEPSASLDIEAESQLAREISSLGKNAICVIISHRMLRSDLVEQIVVLDKGQIIEKGAHEELLALNGRYALLWRACHQLNGNGPVESLVSPQFCSTPG